MLQQYLYYIITKARFTGSKEINAESANSQQNPKRILWTKNRGDLELAKMVITYNIMVINPQ